MKATAYGIFGLGIFIATRPLITKSWTRSRVILFLCLITILFASTWDVFYIETFEQIATRFTFIETQPSGQGGIEAQLQIAEGRLSPLQFMPPWIGTIAVLLSDSIVVWRAWTFFEHAKLPRYLLAFLMIANIGVNIADCIWADIEVQTELTGSTILDWFSGVLSVVVNMVATGLIAWKAWNHHQLMVEAEIRRRSRAEDLLLLLIESGAIYCALQVAYIVVTLINTYAPERLASTPLVAPVIETLSVIVAEWYPVAVIILVNKDSSPVLETFQVNRTNMDNRESHDLTPVDHSDSGLTPSG
ncbi:hypothetical protein GYMLUDRAFT_737035 [Collybiopsis luxurians FD-317 M1]|uniref:Uncharacterized protein n=1 Tax=Collybiopsis luxurians FD-317 M1 TaxID=944289 RepID=A0A0D0CQX3_9AGAR|nr:hypothetical protein GYMLUDRAFT_737035 [Collybiopsis luxurians FD-317 M1]